MDDGAGYNHHEIGSLYDTGLRDGEAYQGFPAQFAVATYSLGFLMFWLMCTGSSLITWFMLPQDIKRTLDKRSREHLDLSHRQRGAPAGGPPAHDRPDDR